ncbi:MAG: kappa-carrageenase [Verrucomicrobiota bacterium]
MALLLLSALISACNSKPSVAPEDPISSQPETPAPDAVEIGSDESSTAPAETAQASVIEPKKAPRPNIEVAETPIGRDELVDLTNSDGRSLQARILYVENGKAFIRRSDQQVFELPLAKLNASSREIVQEWAEKHGNTVSDEQILYLHKLGFETDRSKSLTALAMTTQSANPQPLLLEPIPNARWQLVDEFSDEFNATDINTGKWNNKLRPWGERAWSTDNLWQQDGKLFIQARYEPHVGPDGNDYFYKVGILQTLKKTTYGYFEARIKGSSLFPGMCPAFWLYSNGRERNPDYPHVTYSEIDIVELQMGEYDMKTKKRHGINYIDLNLHCRIIKDGKEIWQRPNSLPEVCKHGWEAPWDPRDDFHVYAVENTPEKITWYIDGKKVAEEDNLYWHLPMNLTLTMELRPPYIDWAGVDGRVPVPEASRPDGFPTHMEVDYVRSWVRED